MISDADDGRLRQLEAQLAVDDPEFVAAFRGRSSLMPGRPQLRGELKMLRTTLTRAAVAVIALLLVHGSYAAAAGLSLLLATGIVCHRSGPAPGRRSSRRGRRLSDRSRGSRST